jgi:uncharacterized protein (TIGR02145 family)
MRKIPLLALLLSSVAFIWTSCEKAPNAVPEPEPDPYANYDTLTGFNTDSTAFLDMRDSNIYDLVQIGTQLWMAENLRYITAGSWEHYANPSPKYGRSYSWASVLTSCPSGWHLSTDAEWQTLEIALGMDSTTAASVGLRGTDQGMQLKSTTGWDNGGNGTNSSGMNVFPTGYYTLSASYYGVLGEKSTFWTATSSDSIYAWGRSVRDSESQWRRDYIAKAAFGSFCRCVLD